MQPRNPLPERLRRLALTCALLVAGGSLAAAEPDLATLVHDRQERFEAMGEAFKLMRDQLRSGSPDVVAMAPAADVLGSYAGQISEWFPAGSGPESGVETDALAYIWKNPEKFARIDGELVPATAALQAAIAAGDPALITEHFSQVGRTCKACHDSFRAD